jgi:hypothetical protein
MTLKCSRANRPARAPRPRRPDRGATPLRPGSSPPLTPTSAACNCTLGPSEVGIARQPSKGRVQERGVHDATHCASLPDRPPRRSHFATKTHLPWRQEGATWREATCRPDEPVERDVQSHVVPCGGAVAALAELPRVRSGHSVGPETPASPRCGQPTPSRVAASHCPRVCTTALERRRSLAFLAHRESAKPKRNRKRGGEEHANR